MDIHLYSEKNHPISQTWKHSPALQHLLWPARAKASPFSPEA